MKQSRALVLIALFCSIQQLQAQTNVADSLAGVLRTFESQRGFEKDTQYLNTLNQFAFSMVYLKPDSSIALSKKSASQAEAIKFYKGQVEALKNIGLANNLLGNYNEALSHYAAALRIAEDHKLASMAGKVLHNRAICFSNLGRYPEALEDYFKALKIREELDEKLGISSSTNGIGTIYFYQGKFDDALDYYFKAVKIAEEINYASGIEMGYANVGEVFLKKKDFAKANEALNKALTVSQQTKNKEVASFITYLMGGMHLQQQQYPEAMAAYQNAITIATDLGSREYICRSWLGLADVFMAINNYDSALHYTSLGLQLANEIGYTELQRDAYESLSHIYEERRDGMTALKYHKLFKSFADSINNQQTEKRAMNLAAEYEYSKKELLLKTEFESRNSRQNWIIFSAFAALVSSLVVVVLIYRSRTREKKSNHLLQQKNKEIDAQRNTLEKALAELKATQHQLIQSEKMASLGEMTAGIAHEIQNPLNFVNNFSDVSVELINELVEESDKGNVEEVKAIANDLVQNLGKISHHGQRAAAIVKGMLQHSRNSNGVKEATDINALCDEYLRLAYHGLRAKDKSFNATFETRLDPTIGKQMVMPQELGRVLLNLINNAFYAVSKKEKEVNDASRYAPTVSIETRNTAQGVEIRIADNGTGIPPQLTDKIFQPFFTTKPTGEGTGLGLSLSYDIITKGHQGQLNVVTEQNEGTTFIIQIPKTPQS